MINTTTYPLLQFIQANKKAGIFSKQALIRKSFLTNKKNTLILPNKSTLNVSVPSAVKEKTNGYLSEILFHGFNFSSKRLKLHRLRTKLDTHKSEVYISIEPVTSTYKSRVYKRRLVFFSYDYDLLNKIQNSIKSFKIPNAYTGKGLLERNDSYNIKKKRKRK